MGLLVTAAASVFTVNLIGLLMMEELRPQPFEFAVGPAPHAGHSSTRGRQGLTAAALSLSENLAEICPTDMSAMCSEWSDLIENYKYMILLS